MSEEPIETVSVLAAELLGLDVPPDCREGVEANLRLLADHARILESWLERPEAETR